MKNGSVFSKIILIVIVSIICIVVTVALALLAGSADGTLFDISDLNLANMIPVILIGGFISCVIVGIIVLFVSKDVFLKLKEYYLEEKKDGGNKE